MSVPDRTKRGGSPGTLLYVRNALRFWFEVLAAIDSPIVTADPLKSKAPKTDYPIDPLLAERWSPRGFDTTRPLSDTEIGSLLEAARWTPSCLNSQPWRFVVAQRGTKAFDQVVEALTGNNTLWAPLAPLLLVACATVRTDDGSALRWAEYDTGQAAAHLTIQAETMGLSVHQMAGFVPEAIRRDFSLPDDVEPVAVIAVGYLDPEAQLPHVLAEREAAERGRLPLADIVVNDWTACV